MARKDLPEYGVWKQMRYRCRNKNVLAYRNYGGRGITVCERWETSFSNFLEDMGRRPSPGHSLERRNNEAGYDKMNCRWATISEQANNKRTNLRLTFEGRTMTMTQWATEIGVTPNCLKHRLYLGWPHERALRR